MAGEWRQCHIELRYRSVVFYFIWVQVHSLAVSLSMFSANQVSLLLSVSNSSTAVSSGASVTLLPIVTPFQLCLSRTSFMPCYSPRFLLLNSGPWIKSPDTHSPCSENEMFAQWSISLPCTAAACRDLILSDYTAESILTGGEGSCLWKAVSSCFHCIIQHIFLARFAFINLASVFLAVTT